MLCNYCPAICAMNVATDSRTAGFAIPIHDKCLSVVQKTIPTPIPSFFVLLTAMVLAMILQCALVILSLTVPFFPHSDLYIQVSAYSATSFMKKRLRWNHAKSKD